jgi:subtilase family serine protease
MDSNLYANDLAQFLSYFSITETNPVGVELMTGASSTPTSDLQEATLDVETIAGLAPGAKIVVYVMPALNLLSFNNALELVQQAGQATIISYSAAACESSASSGTSSVIASLSSSIAIIAAAGDSGSACFDGMNSMSQNLYLQGVGYPASDPNVIGVGGTETFSNTGPTTLTSTAVFNDTLLPSNAQEAGGGGVSSVFTIPSYQNGVSGKSSSQYRNVPDISMPADEAALYLNGGWHAVSGTSWSAPQFAAMLSEVYQYCNVTSLSNPVALPYTAFSRANYNSYIDVVSGNNGFPLVGDPSLSYTAGPGYDNASGIGVPLGMPFANALCPNRVPTSAAQMVSTASRAQQVRSEAYALDVTPRIQGLSDLGRRGASESTSIQLVISSAGSAANNEQSAIAALQAAGFAIGQTFSNHLVVNATGPSSAVESLFSTQMHNVSQAQSIVYMPTNQVTVPAALAPYVAGVVLDNVVTFSSHRR